MYVCFNLPLYQNFTGSRAKDQEEGTIKVVLSMFSMALLAELNITSSFCS